MKQTRVLAGGIVSASDMLLAMLDSGLNGVALRSF
jgi:hypothetical protein